MTDKVGSIFCSHLFPKMPDLLGASSSTCVIKVSPTQRSSDSADSQSSQPEWKCHVCNKSLPLEPKKDVVRCSGCQAFHHQSCAKKNTVLPSRSFARCCGQLQQNINKAENSDVLDRIMSSITTLRNDIPAIVQRAVNAECSAINNKLDDIMNSFSNLEARLSVLENDAPQIAENVIQLETRVAAIETRNSSMGSLSSTDMELAVAEMAERHRRSHNVIALGLPEENTQD